MDDQPTVGAVLEQIAPRLRAVRMLKGVSLAELERVTGISKSTLSRLETSQRKPSLDLLLPVVAALGVKLDAIVASPRITGGPLGDARTGEAHGHTGRVLIPLARRQTAPKAHLLLIPARDSEPYPRVHAGHIWLYVLKGRMRLILGGRDVVLAPHEAAEFDCTTRHWFGATGPGDVELISIFGEQGERMHLRTRSR